jgi:hypothetical protein
MIEEDLIFPCGQRSFPRVTTDLPGVEPTSPSSPVTPLPLSSDGWPAWLFLDSTQASPKSFDSGPALNLTPLSTYFSSQSTFTLNHSTLSPSDDINDHPQDHTRLKTAWDAMLSSRFLAAQLVSVLPFYLSSFFVDVRTHPSIQIPLPPNSRSTGKNSSDGVFNETGRGSIDLDIFSELKTSSGGTSAEARDDALWTQPKKSTKRVPSCASMHLAKTVQTVIECKESIWVEYEKLYCSSVPWATRSVNGKETQLLTFHPSAREDFERAWSNWKR